MDKFVAIVDRSKRSTSAPCSSGRQRRGLQVETACADVGVARDGGRPWQTAGVLSPWKAERQRPSWEWEEAAPCPCHWCGRVFHGATTSSYAHVSERALSTAWLGCCWLSPCRLCRPGLPSSPLCRQRCRRRSRSPRRCRSVSGSLLRRTCSLLLLRRRLSDAVHHLWWRSPSW